MATKHIIIACILVLFSSQAALPQEAQLSNTRTASCVLQITYNTEFMNINFSDIQGFLRSVNVYGKATQEVFGLSQDDVRIEIEVSSPNKSIPSKGLFTYSSEIIIELPESVKPAANEFLKALIDNLKKSITKAHDQSLQGFKTKYKDVKNIYERAESELKKLTEEATAVSFCSSYNESELAVMEQLDTVVDLSQLDPGMSIEDVLAKIRHSVEPPLQIQPNWSDLADLPDIQPTTPIQMWPLTGVKVRAALDNLLSGLSTLETPLGYIVRDGVIIIASKDALPKNLITTVYDISGLLVNGRSINTLIQAIKETIEPESWYDSDTDGEGKIIDMQGGKISVYNTPEVQNKIIEFLEKFPKEIPTGPIEGISIDNLVAQRQGLAGQKQMLELDVARLEARQNAVEQQIVTLSGKVQNKDSSIILEQRLASLVAELEHAKITRTENNPEVVAIQKEIDAIKKRIESSKNDIITTELEQLIEYQTQQLAFLKQQVDVGQLPPNALTAAEEKLVQAKIQLARRREELAIPVGIEQLSAHNELLSNIVIELAGKKAEYKVIEKQLSEIESQIRYNSTPDPRIMNIYEGYKALENAKESLDELKEMEANLQPPIVIAIGLD